MGDSECRPIPGQRCHQATIDEELREEWRPVRGFEKSYEVSNLGRVRSLDRIIIRGGRRHKLRGITKKPKRTATGLMVLLSINGEPQHQQLSRIVAQAFIPEFEPCFYVGYRDRNPLNLRADNLRLITKREAAKSCIRTGKSPTDTRTIPGEQWRAIAEFDDYEISDHGRVRTRERRFRGKSGKTRTLKPAIVSQFVVGGRPVVAVWRINKQVRRSVLKLMAQHWPDVELQHEANGANHRGSHESGQAEVLHLRG